MSQGFFVMMIRKLLVASLLACSSYLSANCWELDAELLVLRPCGNNFEYAAVREGTNPLVLQLNAQAVTRKYTPAFRVGATYNMDCSWYIQGHYSYYDTSSTASVRAPGSVESVLSVAPPTPQTGIVFYDFARANIVYYYHNADLLLGARAFDCCRVYGTFYAGAAFARIQNNRHIYAENIDGPAAIKVRSTLWGIGPKVGISGGFRLCGPLDLFGDFALSAFVGERALETDGFRSTDDITASQSFGSQMACVPSIYSRLGLSACWQCGCYTLTGRIGYEQTYYVDAMSQTATFNSTGIVNFKGIGFGGPFLAVEVGF